MRSAVAISLLLVSPGAFAIWGSEYASPIGGIILAALIVLGFIEKPLETLLVFGLPLVALAVVVVVTLKFGGWGLLGLIVVGYLAAVAWEKRWPRERGED